MFLKNIYDYVLCPSSIISEKNPKFQKLHLFPSAGEILGRRLLSFVCRNKHFFCLWNSSDDYCMNSKGYGRKRSRIAERHKKRYSWFSFPERYL